jgi:VWFA-related protein
MRVAAVILLAGVLDAQERRDVPTFSSQVALVTVDAVVLDADGKPVRGLTREDFALFEDGAPQAIASFEAFDLGEAPAAKPEPSPGGVNNPSTNVGPPPSGARSLRLSTPIVTDRLSARDGVPPQPVLMAHRRFARPKRIYWSPPE